LVPEATAGIVQLLVTGTVINLSGSKVWSEVAIPGLGDSGLTIEGTWSASEKGFTTAWGVYVELSTRIGITGLDPGTGNLREVELAQR
jgi:hypothetical protein